MVQNMKYRVQNLQHVRNCYLKPAKLFVTGGKEISSEKGTTQGGPIAMAF